MALNCVDGGFLGLEKVLAEPQHQAGVHPATEQPVGVGCSFSHRPTSDGVDHPD